MMHDPTRPVLVSMQPIRSIRVLVLGAALAACGGNASGPGMPSQPGDAGSGPDAPETTITAPQAGATTTATVSVEFSAPGTGLHFECRLDAEPASACTSPRVYTNLTDGMHTVYVRAITPDSVAGPEASRSFTVDASLPTVTVSGPPARDSVTRVTGTELSFSADKPNSTITCRIDGDAPAPCASPLELSGLSDGVHTVVFQATSGTHVGPQVVWSWTVDTVAPSTVITGPVTDGHPVRERLPTLTGTTEPGAAVSIHIAADCGLPVAGTGTAAPTGAFAVMIVATVPAAPDGVTTYYAHATDLAGNTSCSGPFSYFTDNTPPAVAVDDLNTAATPSRDRRPTLTGTAEAGATVRVFRGAGCTGPSTAPATSTGTWSIAIDAATEAAADGLTTYSAQASDAAGNAGCADVAYFTDNTPPAVAITAPVTDALHGMRSRRPVLSGTAETGATIQVFRGDACTGPATTTTTAAQGTWSIATDPTTDTPADGPTIYTARATDPLGNAGCSAAFTYFSDNTPPETTITSPAVPTFTNDEQRTFTFTSNEPAAHFQCAFGTGAFAPCISPVFPSSANLGPIQFQVRAIDFAGNVDPSPASFTWTTTEMPLIQYGFEGNAANTGALALDGTPDFTGSVQNADFVPGRFGKALAFRSSPTSKFVAPVKDVIRRADRLNISFWFREDTVRASVGDAALFDNGVARIFHATADSALTVCLRTTCKTFTYSVGDWHQLRLDWSALQLFVRVDNVEATDIIDFGSPFAGSTDIELGRGTNFMVDDLRVYDAELFQFLNGHPECQIFAFYDRSGNCGSGPALRFGVEFEQSGDGATRFAPGRVDVYAAQLTSTALTDGVNAGTWASYWARVDASQTAAGNVFRTSSLGGIAHLVSGTRHLLSFAGQNVALPTLAVGWHHFIYSFEGPPSGTGTAKAFVDGMLVKQVDNTSDPRAGTAQLGGDNATSYIDSLRVYGGSVDPQTICQLGPAGNWLFSTQTCGLADDLLPGLCVDAAAGSDTASGDCAHPFATITHALAAASPGQAILVRPGTYDAAHGEVFPLVIGERTAVIGDEAQRGGAGAAPTRIVGCAADPAGEGDDVTVILAGPRSSISGFDLSCPTRGRPIVVDADGATVRRVHIAQAHVAIAHAAVLDTTLLGNELVDSDTAIAFSGEPRIEANRITNNGIGLLQQDASTLDAGGGPRGSHGGNQLYCNTLLDLSSGANILRLRNNAWDEIPPLVATVPAGCIGLRTDICLLTPNATLDTTGATLAPAPRCELD